MLPKDKPRVIGCRKRATWDNVYTRHVPSRHPYNDRQMNAVEYLASIRSVYQAVGLSLALRPAANEDDTRRVQAQFGHDPLLALLSNLWRISNGSEPYYPVFVRPGFLTGYDLLLIEGALAEYEGMRRRAPQYAGYEEDTLRDPRIAEGWWNEGWLPFAGFGGSSLLLILDLSPGPMGRAGQVIAYTHDPDQMAWVAESLPELFRASVDAFREDADEILEGLLDELDPAEPPEA